MRSDPASTRSLAVSCRTHSVAEEAARRLHAQLQPCPRAVTSMAAWFHEVLLAVCSPEGLLQPQALTEALS